MNIMTDQHAALAALPPGFTPIENPEEWSPAQDLKLYLAEDPIKGAPALPANATVADAYAHVRLLLQNAVAEQNLCLAVRAAFNEGRRDSDHVRALLARPRRELIEHLRAVDLALADIGIEDSELATKTKAYVNGQLDEALFLDDERERMVGHHVWESGAVSLWQLLELVYHIGGLSCELVEFYWVARSFQRLFEAVAAPLRTEGFLLLNTAPEPDVHVITSWHHRTLSAPSGGDLMTSQQPPDSSANHQETKQKKL